MSDVSEIFGRVDITMLDFESPPNFQGLAFDTAGGVESALAFVSACHFGHSSGVYLETTVLKFRDLSNYSNGYWRSSHILLDVLDVSVGL